jgi:2-methylaconitate cis-trans-isomerase PrpF
MRQFRIPAVFMRGGTSNAIVFHRRDLPEDQADWDEIFLAAMGSPDPYQRQLNGMGGGISSLSKVCIVGPSDHSDADIDYTFAQVSPRDDWVSYAALCGNMSAAMGPFGVDEGLVEVEGDEATVRIHNTNTGMIIHAHFPLDEGQAAVDGDYAQIGVAGTGAPERLDFISPGGAITGKLLPTGNLVDTVEVPGLGKIEASLIDAGNSFAFVEAGVFGLTGTESPTEIDSRPGLLDAIETARNHMGVLMGLSATPEESRTKLPNQPKIAMVSPPQDAVTLTGETVKAADGDLTARIISSGNCHRALPLTGAIGTSVAARIEGTVANRFARQPGKPDQDIHLMQPSGVMTLKPVVTKGADGWTAERVGVYRTHRRLFDGYVYLPASKVPRMAAREAKLSTAAE